MSIRIVGLLLLLGAAGRASFALHAAEVGTRPTDGTLLVDGKPFFPVGFYHSSHAPQDDVRRLADLEIIARAGFNVIATPLTLGNSELFLGRAARLGVHVLVESNDAEGLFVMVKKLKGQPGLLGWQIADDVDSGRHVPEEVRRRYAQVKTLDRDRLAYVSAGFAKKMAAFVTCADVIGMQTYPVPDEEMSATYHSVAAAVKAATPHHRAVIANCQSFAWAAKRAPTPKETRSMTYQSLVAGARGVIYYTYFDRTNYLPDRKVLWRECASLAVELNALGPVLLDGKRSLLVAPETDQVKAAYWSHAGQSYVIACNISATRPFRITIHLPTAAGKRMHVLFGTSAKGLSLERDVLTGELPPAAVWVASTKGP